MKLIGYNRFKLNGKLKSIEKANNTFPNGILDWYASAFLIALILLPISIIPRLISFKFHSQKGYLIYFCFTTVFVILYVYYKLYIKDKEWLKTKIKRIRKKYEIPDGSDM